jgi:hypothetical protein
MVFYSILLTDEWKACLELKFYLLKRVDNPASSDDVGIDARPGQLAVLSAY